MSSIHKTSQKISPCLWFDDQAEDAAKFYTGIFRNSKIVRIARYGKGSDQDPIHGRKAGSVMTVEFETGWSERSRDFNGGRTAEFDEAISLQDLCGRGRSWTATGTKPLRRRRCRAQQCGWLKDKFGVSWQVVPTVLQELRQRSRSRLVAARVRSDAAVKKLDIAGLQRAYAGSGLSRPSIRPCRRRRSVRAARVQCAAVDARAWSTLPRQRHMSAAAECA